MSSSPISITASGGLTVPNTTDAKSPRPSVGAPFSSAVGTATPSAAGSAGSTGSAGGSSLVANDSNIIVGVRVRPFDANEIKNNERLAWDIDTQQNQIRQKYSLATSKNSELLTFPVNHLFGPDSDTKTVYDTIVRGIVLSAMRGVNGTTFAYGQTSSGKTYT